MSRFNIFIGYREKTFPQKTKFKIESEQGFYIVLSEIVIFEFLVTMLSWISRIRMIGEKQSFT